MATFLINWYKMIFQLVWPTLFWPEPACVAFFTVISADTPHNYSLSRGDFLEREKNLKIQI